MWKHKAKCTKTECYCIDPDDAEPICDCGAPGSCCECPDDQDEFWDDLEYDDEDYWDE